MSPIHGFAAATVIAISAASGSLLRPQVLSSAILGVGATKRLSTVRWGIAGRIVTAWGVTSPARAAFRWLVYSLLHLITSAR